MSSDTIEEKIKTLSVDADQFIQESMELDNEKIPPSGLATNEILNQVCKPIEKLSPLSSPDKNVSKVEQVQNICNDFASASNIRVPNITTVVNPNPTHAQVVSEVEKPKFKIPAPPPLRTRGFKRPGRGSRIEHFKKRNQKIQLTQQHFAGIGSAIFQIAQQQMQVNRSQGNRFSNQRSYVRGPRAVETPPPPRRTDEEETQ